MEKMIENWSVAPNKAFYNLDGEDAEKLKSVGLPIRFEALSVGNEQGQIAIIPLDNSNEFNARLISYAPVLFNVLFDIIHGDINSNEIKELLEDIIE